MHSVGLQCSTRQLTFYVFECIGVSILHRKESSLIGVSFFFGGVEEGSAFAVVNALEIFPLYSVPCKNKDALKQIVREQAHKTTGRNRSRFREALVIMHKSLNKKEQAAHNHF